MKNFLGLDGFIWWIGVVEDVNDPNRLGRIRVRCFGYHPPRVVLTREKRKSYPDGDFILDAEGNRIIEEYEPDDQGVPTADLPWALVVHPLNTPNLYGTPNVGDYVFGFFLDGQNAQEPALMGYFPGIPTQQTGSNFGNSPRKYIRQIGKTSADDLEGTLIRDFNLFSQYTRVNDPGFDIANTVIWESRAGRHSPNRHGHFLLFYDTPGGEILAMQSSGDARLRFIDNPLNARLTELISSENRSLVFNDSKKILSDDDERVYISIGIGEYVALTSNNSNGSHYLKFNDRETKYKSGIIGKDHYVELKSSGGHSLILYDTKSEDDSNVNKYIKLASFGGHSVTLNDETEELVIQSKEGSTVTLDKDGNITLIATNTINLTDDSGTYKLSDFLSSSQIAQLAWDTANAAFDKANLAYDSIPSGVSVSVSTSTAIANTPTGTGTFVTSVSATGTLTS